MRRCIRKLAVYSVCISMVASLWSGPVYAAGDFASDNDAAAGSELPEAAVPSEYYVDAVNGDDGNTGNSPEQAWKSLEKVNATQFEPGDRILFRSGCSWVGQLWPKGSGTGAAPIVIDRYGEGSMPLIAGNTKMVNGQDQDYYKGAAVVLHNQEYWEINNLEITNIGSETTTGPDADVEKVEGLRRIGVTITSRGTGDGNETFEHIYLNNLNIHDITGSIDRNNGGILVTSQYGKNRTNFSDVRIENCSISNVIGNGITTTSDYVQQYLGTEETGGNPTRWGEFPGKTTVDWGAAPQFKSKDIRVAGCTLNNIWCDAILTLNVDHPVVEYNVTSNTCYANGAYASIWPHSSNDALIQFNEVYDTRYVGADGQAFDVDYNCDNAVLQYNYSHDNEGGFLLLMESANYPTVRYNISQNDGTKGTTIGLMDLNAGFVQIYNNTFYSDVPVFSTRIEGGLAGNGIISNNIFCAKEPVNMTAWATDVKKSYEYHNNAVFNYSSFPEDKGLITADPGLADPGTAGIGRDSVDGYRLRLDSPCIDNGITVSDSGNRDYWGTPLTDGKTDIGACEALVKEETGDDIPVKAQSIIVTSENNRTLLDKKNPTLQLYAEVLPFEADIHEVEWKVVSPEGKPTSLAEITREGVLTGKENGVVRVVALAKDGSGASGGLTVTLQMVADSANQVVDDLNIDDFSKMYEHSGELWMDKNGADYFGDNARLIRSNKFDTSFIRYATYHYERISGFKVTSYYQNYEGTEETAIEDIRFYVSEDNENWREITASEYETEDTLLERGPEGGSLWTKRIYTCSGLEGGDSYFKVTFPQEYNAGKYYDPNIGQIILNLAAEVEEIQVQSDSDSIAEPAGRLHMRAVAYPEGMEYTSVNWSVSNTDGTPTDKAMIDADGTLRAYNNGDIVVTATSRLDKSISGSKTIHISGQPANILDTYQDFSKIWEYNGMQLEYVGWFDGGTYTIHPWNGSTDRYIVYKAGNIRGFATETYFLTGQVRELRFYASEDGEEFHEMTEVPFDEVEKGGTAGRRYHMEHLPDNVNYLKIQMEENFSWEANITSTQLFFDEMTGIELEVVSDADSIETYNGQLQMKTNPENLAVNWKVEDENGAYTQKAVIDENGLLTGKSKGTVYVRATAKADQSISARKAITINTRMYTEVYDDFRYSEGYETGNADNLLNKTLEHSGGFWHQKMDWAGAYGLYVHEWMAPSFLTYECKNLTAFEVKTLCRYDYVDGVDFVIKGSKDGKTWETVENITKQDTGGNWPFVSYSKEDMTEGYHYLRVEFPDCCSNCASNVNLCSVDLVSEVRVEAISIRADKGAVEGKEDCYVVPQIGDSIQFTASTGLQEIPGLIHWDVVDAEAAGAEPGDMENGSSRAVITDNGLLTARDYGKVIVTASATDGSEVSKSVEVEIMAVHPESIVLNKQNKIMEIGDVMDLCYRIAPANAVNQKVSFATSDPDVVTVTSSGRCMAQKAGEADITVTTEDGGIQAVCHIVVSEARAYLEKVIREAEQLQEEDYLSESWKGFAEAYEQAKEVLADKSARRADWQEAAEMLLDAMNLLTDKEEAFAELKALIRKARAVDFTKYTEESYASVQTALAEAEKLLEEGSKAESQKIDEAWKKLKEALEGLKEKGNESKPEVPDGGNGTDNPDGGNGTDNPDAGDNAGTDPGVETGDASPLWMAVAALISSCAAMVAVFRRKRRV